KRQGSVEHCLADAEQTAEHNRQGRLIREDTERAQAEAAANEMGFLDPERGFVRKGDMPGGLFNLGSGVMKVFEKVASAIGGTVQAVTGVLGEFGSRLGRLVGDSIPVVGAALEGFA